MPVSDLKDELNLEETPIVTGECADIISDYINVSHKVQEIYRQYQMYQEALGEWIHYDLDEDKSKNQKMLTSQKLSYSIGVIILSSEEFLHSCRSISCN